MDKPVGSSIQIVQTRLGGRLDYIVPVIVPAEIGLILSNNGYQISIDPSNPEFIQATKGTAQIYMDGSRRFFGARSGTVSESISTMTELYSLVKKNLQVDLAKYVKFYEFEFNANYFTGEDVYYKLSHLYEDSADLATLKEILGGEYSQLTLKLAPSGQNVNSTEWHEVTIEPKVNSTGNTFTIRMICRYSKLQKVKVIAQSTEENICSIIERVLLKRTKQ